MKAPTLEEMEFMKNMTRIPSEKEGTMYLFQDAKGFIYITSEKVPQSPTDTIIHEILESIHFSPKARRLIQNFEVRIPSPEKAQDDLFPDTLPALQDYMHFCVSEMLGILISEGSDSPKLERIVKKELLIRNIQTPLLSWDPSKGKEIQTFTERRVHSTKTRIAYVLRGR